jgi:hypothetical protein
MFSTPLAERFFGREVKKNEIIQRSIVIDHPSALRWRHWRR